MSHIKINSSNFFHNLQTISDRLGSVDKLMIVLKDNAYGHGLLGMAKLASEFGVKRAVVRGVQEAREIKKYFEYILVLADMPLQKENNKISITANSLESLQKIPDGSNIELKTDSGMHRNGVTLDEINRAYKIAAQKKLNVKGVFTHFRSADELSPEFFWQVQNFEQIKKESIQSAKEFGFDVPFFHSANSAAVFRFDEFKEDFARCGIAVYGYVDLREPFDRPKLLPVLSLWGEKLSQREIKKGQRVGYGGVFEAQKDITASNYDIGYGDGFFRYDGKGDLKSADNKKILGRVSMDNLSIEDEKDEVCIFDDADYIAGYFNTISYDVLVKLSPKIKRIII